MKMALVILGLSLAFLVASGVAWWQTAEVAALRQRCAP